MITEWERQSTPADVKWDTYRGMQPTKPHAMIINDQKGMFIPESFVATEQGNTLLESPAGLETNAVAWIDLVPGVRLQITLVTNNSPALHVGIHTHAEASLAAHIQANLNGWIVYRCNVEGVETEQECEDLVVVSETST